MPHADAPAAARPLPAAARPGRAAVLRPAPLSSFARAEDLAALAAPGPERLFAAPGAATGGYLNDIGTDAYALGLADALVVPLRRLGPPVAPTGAAGRLPRGLVGRGEARLFPHVLVASGDRVIADSFLRGRQAPDELAPLADGTWAATLPRDAATVEEPCLFLELLCGHFGHALTDTPGRLWPLAEPGGAALARLRPVALGTHGIGANPARIPAWLRALIAAWGLDPARLLLVGRPTRFRRLVVPGRIAPFRTAGGPRYNALMQRAGDRLLASGPAAVGAGPRVFLSRSRLPRGSRRVEGLPEEALDALFAGLGWTVVHPQDLPLSEQVALVRGARMIAGVGGSQLHLAAFARAPGPRMLRLVPAPWRPDTDAKILGPLGGSVTDLPLDPPPGADMPARKATLHLTAAALERIRAAAAAFGADA